VRKALVVSVLALWLAPAAAAAVHTRLLYASDWTGPTQIFSVDPSARSALRQVTFTRPDRCSIFLYPVTCGFFETVPSPDGMHIAYRSTGAASELWIAGGDGRNARLVAPNLGLFDPGSAYAAWSPDSRRLAYRAKDGFHLVRANGSAVGGDAAGTFRLWSARLRKLRAYRESVVSPDGRWTAFADIKGIFVTNRRTHRTRLLLADEDAFSLSWAPDSKSLAYVAGYLHSGTSDTRDLKIVTLAGRERTVLSSYAPYGGRIASVAWTRSPARLRYRAVAPVEGLYAGGDVSRLAADGNVVAFSACNSVYAWTPPATEAVLVDANPWGPTLCFPPADRVQVYDLAVAGDVAAFGRAYGGLGPRMVMYAAQLAPPHLPRRLSESFTAVGSHRHGVGTLAGGDGLLVFSSWSGRETNPNGDVVVDSQIIYRADACVCPSPDRAIASSPGRAEPLDAEGGRVVVGHAFWADGTWSSRQASLALLDATGTELLSLPVDAAAAQLSGRDLVVAAPGRLVDYDAQSGELVRVWPLPEVATGRDCLFWSGPTCPALPAGPVPARLTLQDAARGIVAYTLDGDLHVLRLADGKDARIGPGNEARFMDAGLVYADLARIHLVSYESLPLR
jgi:hypothetical protein